MNINFRKSLRKSSRSSTFYLESFEMYDQSIKNLSLEEISKHSSSSIPVIDFRVNEFMIPIKPITSVIKYDLNSERSKGIIGQIVLTNFRLKFIPYSSEHNLINNNSTNKLNGDLNDKQQTTKFNDKQLETDLNDKQLKTDSNDKQQVDLKDKKFNFPPFELISTNDKKIDENIEYLNIYDLICQQNLLQIYCADFRCLEFQFKSSYVVKSLAEQLDRLIIKPISSSSMQQISQNLSPSTNNNNALQNIIANRDFELTYLWTIIGSQFMFNYPKQWEENEGYWYESNNLLRITQANENYQLCKSLPASFITLKYYIADFDLLLNISSKMKGQRIPIITYSQKCKQKSNQFRFRNRFNNQLDQDNMLIRSGIMNKDVSYSLKQAIKSLNIIEVNDLGLPDKATFHSTYIKLRDACFLHSNTNHFLSQIGKWMKLIYKVLSIVNDLSKVLNEESSLILMENNDNHWNILLSCLIQITLDKNRRTIDGFNSLLSKEWIYLVGLRTNSTKSFDHSKLPDPILFTLFLDCVYQMINQNTVSFEFTSLYLIRCFDLSFIPYSAIVKQQSTKNDYLSNHLIINDKLSSFKMQSIKKQSSPVLFSKFTQSSPVNTISSLFNNHNNHNNLNDKLSPILKNLTFEQTLFYFNPFYKKTNNITKLTISSSILSIQFWRPLYLRWSKPFLNLNYYNQFFSSEYLYFRELIVQSNSEFKQIISQSSDDNSCKMDNLSIDNSLNNFSSNDTNDNSPEEDSYEHF